MGATRIANPQSKTLVNNFITKNDDRVRKYDVVAHQKVASLIPYEFGEGEKQCVHSHY